MRLCARLCGATPQESYAEYVLRLAQADGLELEDAADLRRHDRRRPKKMSNQEWVNPNDPEAEITRLKDGRTALAYKSEQAVDMESGAIVAVTTHGGSAADAETVEATVIEAGVAVAEVAGERDPQGQYPVHPGGIQEVVADKGYHSNEVLCGMRELQMRTYIAEPQRGSRNWRGKQAEKAAVYANRRRILGKRGKSLQAARGERIERNFAHQYDTGGMEQLFVRGLTNVHKKLLLQAAACNLALLMRTRYGAGKPRAAHDRAAKHVLALLAFMRLLSVA